MEEKILYLKQRDPTLSQIIDEVGTCEIGNNKQNIFSYLIGLIFGQKIRFKTARKKRSLLYSEIGYNFGPSEILNLSLDQWNKIGIEEYVREIVLRVGNFCLSHPLTNTSNVSQLKQINGIGDWTINCLLIVYGLDLNVFPTNDKHVNKILKQYFEGSVKQLWDPYKSVAFWYLWKYQLKV